MKEREKEKRWGVGEKNSINDFWWKRYILITFGQRERKKNFDMINFCYALLDSGGAVESKNNISSKIYFKRSKQLNWSTAEFQSFQCTFFFMFARPRLQSSRPFAVVGFVMTILKNKNLSNKLQFLSGSLLLLPFSADDMCLHDDHLEQVSKPPARRMRSAKRQSGRKMQASTKKQRTSAHFSFSLLHFPIAPL